MTQASLPTSCAEDPRTPYLSRGELPVALFAIGLCVALAYGGLFDAWFHPIDDALHIAGVIQGKYPIDHPRPAHFAWNRALFAIFGTNAAAWHAAGLALHAASASLLWYLARGVGASRVAALGAACVFAALHAPLSAVAWISAVSGPLVVFFVLLCGVAWWRHLEAEAPGPRRFWYVATLLALLAATMSKQDCVLAGPLLIGLHVARSGWRAFLRGRPLARYAPFILIGLAYLAIAFDPTVWSNRPGVGAYDVSFAILPRALTNLVVLVWPRHLVPGVAPGWMLPVGVAAFGLLSLVARSGCARWQRLVWLGLATTLFGLLPVLPGPWEAVAASRLGYPSAIGVGLIAAGLFDGARAFSPRFGTRMAAGALVLFCTVHAWSVRSTVEWRFVSASHDYASLMSATFATLEQSATGSVLFVAPPIWNELDHERGAIAFAAGRPIETERVSFPFDELDGQLEAWKQRAEVVTWSENTWRPITEAGVDRARLNNIAEANATHGFADRVPATWLRRGSASEL